MNFTASNMVKYEVQNVAREITRVRSYMSPRTALDFITALQEELESHLQDAINVCTDEERQKGTP